jgi:hypothetical protein
MERTQMFGSVARRLVGWSPAGEVALATAASARSRRRILAAPDADEKRFDDAMASRVRKPHVVFGCVVCREGKKPYLFPTADFNGLFGWLTGGTGSGKSRTSGCFIDALAAPLVMSEESSCRPTIP